MGCDIHLYVEVRKNGKWEQAGQMVENPYYYKAEETDNPESKKMVREDFWEGRNYQLFGTLARGVRTKMTPSFKPKGLPRDVSKEVQTISEGWDGDGHTHSWLDLQELMDFAYGAGYAKEGINRFAAIDQYFAEVTMPKLVKLAAEPGLKPEDIRIVFFFDN